METLRNLYPLVPRTLREAPLPIAGMLGSTYLMRAGNRAGHPR